jgi:hypothetical protein
MVKFAFVLSKDLGAAHLIAFRSEMKCASVATELGNRERQVGGHITSQRFIGSSFFTGFKLPQTTSAAAAPHSAVAPTTCTPLHLLRADATSQECIHVEQRGGALPQAAAGPHGHAGNLPAALHQVRGAGRWVGEYE